MRAHVLAIAIVLGGLYGPTSSADAPPPGQVVMPNLVGMTEDQAKAAVKKAGFAMEMEQSRPIECENAPEVEGHVNCQDPDAGKTVSKHTLVQVTIYHSHLSQGGKDKQLMDSVVGMAPDKAQVTIKKVHPDWPIKLTPPTNSGGGEIYDAKCGENKVCGWELVGDPANGGPPAILYVNRSVKISAPPPP